ncbi:ABC transporter permease [Pontibacillus litoralis]|uniref:ABC-2 type transporter transmembrane domain-containing protein n=1 Tax=Pontibacillus litoralis JSM 072002 TaxID=1385512 RepID=A0A0A5FZR1_9BACI|nr:ABC transporter permease [Pontibacillus litoralis]KGX85284.1 hypothetical protein N784_09595 [Pontibacillus litoralis JSM 072002]
MNKFMIIVGHTYTNRLKSKAFMITTLITLLFVMAFANLETIIGLFSGEDEEERVAVVEEGANLFEHLQGQLEPYESEVKVEKFEGTEQEAKDAVTDGDYVGVLSVSLAEDNIPQGTYYTEQISEYKVSSLLEQALQQLKVTVASQSAQVEQATINEIMSPVAFEKVSLKEDAKTEEELSQTRGLVYIMLFLLYFGVLMYGSMISTEVATEKSSRVMEILISSVSPVKQMFGKIFGIALLGLTQFGLIVLVGYIAVQQNKEFLDSTSISSYLGFSNIEISTLIYAIVFFLLGYMLYATIAAVLGSLVSRTEDAQQVMTPMILLIVVAFFLAMTGLSNPEATYVTVTSFIPLFTPMLMFLRVGMLEVPMWEVAISLVILVATIVALGIIGGRIYRGGVLLYGRSSSFKDIKKALQLTKKE